MSAFFVIFNRSEQTGRQVQEQTVGNATVAPAKVNSSPSSSSATWMGTMESALIVKLEGTSLTTVAECISDIQRLYPGEITGPPVVVTEAAFKEA